MTEQRYIREREIARGGMGAVWLGRDEVLGRPVAIKRIGLVPGAGTPDLDRAEREARIAASLNHPNIINVFDLLEEGGEQWLVMEYVEGRTLADLIRERGSLTPEQAAPILAQVASALRAAHASDIVHRDVKPSNILIREDGQVKLTDFGIARAVADASLTQTGLVTGSPAYLSPEVASGRPATPASDVWSLGATLFNALAGRAPYEAGENVLGALYRIVNEPPPRVENAGPLDHVLRATMTHDPRARWTMAEVATALQAVGSDAGPAAPAPPAAPPPPVPDVSTDDGTRTLGPTQVIPAAAPTGPPPVAPPARRRAAATERRRRPVLPIVVAVLVILLLGVIVALALQDDPQDTGDDLAGSGDPTTSQSEPTSGETTSAPAYTEDDLRNFIENYLATASSDPSAGFTMLTPGFQAESPGYEQFWGSVTNPRLLSFSADPDNLTVEYTYRYNRRGEGSITEPVSLQLVDDNGTLLIDGES